jgi:hypothetical protein
MKSKALLLLFIFLLNTATGFACALRMSNHEKEDASEHHHKGEEATEHHHEAHQQVSQDSNQQHHVLNGIYIAKNDPCCQAAISNFNALAKVAPQSNSVTLLAPFIYIGMDYQFFLKPVPNSSKSNELSSLKERRRPPTYPVRIAIQSFQI